MDVFLVQALIFMASILFVVGLGKAFKAGKKVKVDTIERPGIFGALNEETETVGRLIEPFMTLVAPTHASRIQNRLVAAGISERLTTRDIFGIQSLAAGAAFVVGGMAIFLTTSKMNYALPGALFLGLIGWVYPTTWLAGTARRRQDAILKSLPFSIDLLTVAMQAGQDFGAALRFLVAEAAPGPLREEWAIMLRETELGKSRVEALRNLAARVQLPELQSVVSAVIQSMEMGASLSGTLKIQAEEVRAARFHRAERQAARAPSIMLIPVALFILPAVFIVIMMPIIIRMKDTLASTQ